MEVKASMFSFGTILRADQIAKDEIIETYGFEGITVPPDLVGPQGPHNVRLFRVFFKIVN